MSPKQLEVEVLVCAAPDRAAFSMKSVVLRHQGCRSPPLNVKRDLASDRYVMRCDCGTEIAVPTQGSAIVQILKVAAGLESVELGVGTYEISPQTGLVRLVPET